MRLYIVTREKGERFVIAGNAVDARRYAIESGIKGHKIDRRVWRNQDNEILEIDHDPGVISQEEAVKILNAAGYNLDGSKYQKPVKARKMAAQITPDGCKICRRCGTEKPLEDFPPRTGGGYQSYCRECKKAIDRENRLKKKIKGGS